MVLRPPNSFRLITLGRLALITPLGAEEESLGKRRRKLALLAVLALSKQPLSRDFLVDMFWGDQDEERARHSLSDTLSHLRRVLGRDAIATRRTEVALDGEALLSVDAQEFAEAVAEREYETAVSLYRGQFLDGVHVGSSPRWEHFAERERGRLHTLFLQSCDKQCALLARTRRWDECAALAQRWLDAAPMSSDAALYQLNALKAPGTREADQQALNAYESLRRRLAREFDTAPEGVVVSLAHDIAGRLAASAPPDAPPSPDLSTLPASPMRTSSDAAGVRHPTPGGIVVRDSAAAAAALSSTTTTESATVLARSTDPAVARATPAESQSRDTPAPPPLVMYTPAAPAPAPPPQRRSEQFPSYTDTLPVPLRRKRRIRQRIGYTLLGSAAGLILAVIMFVMAAGGGGSGGAGGSPGPRADAGVKPTLAVASIWVASTDTSLAWLGDGLPQMIAAKLFHSSAVEVVPPTQVRAVRVRSGRDDASRLTAEDIVEIGKRTGASVVAAGNITRNQSGLILDLSVYDVATGKPVSLDALAAPDAIALADKAAARLLAAGGAGGSGPQLAGVETPNVEAYQHFMRSLQAGEEGRFNESVREVDAAIALDSGFVAALQRRLEMAVNGNETELVPRLHDALRKNESRSSEWDRLTAEAWVAYYNGEHARSEARALQLVERYPRDPRAIGLLATFYTMHARWADAEKVLERLLALDSLGIRAGNGPCVACAYYGGLGGVRQLRGDWDGAERSMRRWVEVQPEAPAAWGTLATVLGNRGRFDDALAAARRAIVVSGGEGTYLVSYARLLLMARRFEAVDSALATWTAAPLRVEAYDIRALLDRERGRLRASNRWVEMALAADPGSGPLRLMEANSLGRLGAYDSASAMYERVTHGRPGERVQFPLLGGTARAFTWHHALLADAIAGQGDTLRLRALADTLEVAGSRSYYGRDWRLHEHVRGLVAMQGGRYEEGAERFQSALYGPAGWTRTNAELAKAYLALGRPRDALATLRDAYMAPLDASARYVPRSELDLLMAVAFKRANAPDSAAVYAGHVRRAWRDADPEVRRMLEELDR